MAIRLGTVAAIGFESFSPAEWLGCFRRLGCTVVQAYRNQEANVSLAQMRDALAAGEMPCDSLHGVFGEAFDPSAPDERARRFAVDTYKAEGELALALGGPLVVVHCSTVRPQGVSPDEKRLRWDQLRRSIAELGGFGRRMGVTYAFENLPAYHAIGSDAGELARVLGEVGAPNTGLCFDTGHANMVADVPSALRAAGKQIVYVHFSDNSGGNDEHEMPTYGSLDTAGVAAALREIRYRGTLMLEVFHDADRLRKLIDAGCAERLADFLAAAGGN